MTLLLLLGGASAGKSGLAVQLAHRRGGEVWFLATAEGLDDEMVERIRAHRAMRPAEWHVVEEPRDLERVIPTIPVHATLILDCLTLWTSNLIEQLPANEIVRRAAGLAASVRERRGLSIVVSNEVGLGLVPPNPLGRVYRDLLGQVNRCWADASDDMWLVVAGRGVRLDPVDLNRWGAAHE